MSTKNYPKLAIVVPCYNEEEVIHSTNEKLVVFLSSLISKNIVDKSSFIAYINDGSKDKTWQIIEELAKGSSLVKAVKLSRNVGHQNALVAGLEHFKNESDCLVSIDADLQDDYTVIEEMVNKYTQGNEIVYGVRKERKKDTFFKRLTALGFYKLMIRMGIELVYNHADFRLSSSRVLDELEKFSEVNLFLRGIFPLIGFKSDFVYYDRMERLAGESKYPFKKMLAFAFEGISSFSIKPLRMVTSVGFIVFIISLFMAGYSLYSFISGGTVPGWTSITLPIYFISGIQLLSLGIIGEYLGKIYKETKKRPRYIIEVVEN